MLPSPCVGLYLAIALFLLVAPWAAAAQELVVSEAPEATEEAVGSRDEDSTDWREVIRVIDGDTIVLNGGERVRLIGVDTPETVHPQKPVEYFGKEASAFTRRTVEGERVRLEYEQGMPSEDRYGRTLAYVHLEDGRLLNLEIIEGGYGHAYTRFPFSKMEEFRAAERYARETRKGLWREQARENTTAPPRLIPSGEPISTGSCIRASQCCKICSKGQACGNSCISASFTCRKGRGCACNVTNLCP